MVSLNTPEGLVEAYYRAMYDADGDALRRVFQPTSRIAGFFADQFIDSDLEGFIRAIAAAPSARSLGEPEDLSILDLKLDGRIGTAIVRDTLHGITYVDHLALVRVGEAWRISGKSYGTATPLELT